MVDLLPPPASGGVQLEGPQEVGSVLEVWSNGEDLVNQILDTDDSKLAQLALDDIVGGDGSTVTIDLDQRIENFESDSVSKNLIFNNNYMKCIKLFPD